MSSYTPRSVRPYYTITLNIEDNDLTNKLTSVAIFNSFNCVYPSIYFKFNEDPGNYFNNKMFGDKDAKLSITLTGPDMSPRENNTFNLIYIPMNVDLKVRSNSQKEENSSLSTLKMIGIPKEPFNIMCGKKINKVFKNMTPLDMVKKVLEEYFPEVKTNIDDNNHNEEKYSQFIVNDMTMSSFIRSLDTNKGIFKGLSHFYCNLDENNQPIFEMWDLSKSVTEDADYDVTFLASAQADEKEVMETGTDAQHFYTSETLTTTNHTNTKITTNAYEHKYIIKPQDKVYDTTSKTMDDIFKEGAIKSGNNAALPYNEAIKSRTTIHANSYTGDGKADIQANLSKYLSNMSKFKFSVNGTIPIQKISNVGRTVTLKSQVVDYATYNQNYISSSAITEFSKDKTAQYNANVTVHCLRSNLEA